MKRGQFVPLTDVQIAEHIRIAKEEHGQELTREDVLNLVKDDEVWLNARYQCAVKLLDNDPLGALHLSIKRRDKKPIHDWRDLQQIKNDVAGAEREALELYPAESRVVDLANQYHLWVVPVGQKIPVGWDNGRYLTDEVGRSGAKQRRRS
jgi:hypothetical protein